MAFCVALVLGACDSDSDDDGATPSLVTTPTATASAATAPADGKDTSTATATATPTKVPPPIPTEVGLAIAFGGRSFDRPVDLLPYPAGRFMVVEQRGRVLLTGADGEDIGLMLDLRSEVVFGGESGLLSVALDPAFPNRPYLYVYSYIDEPTRTVIDRYEVRGDTGVTDSRLRILEVGQPFNNHNGGALRFGPDGMLYLGLGDGGSGNDPRGNGQDLETLLGTVIRIDVSNATEEQTYAIPPDNPFVDGPAPEIWAYGLRNPWRMAFDAETGLLWAGDVGQLRVEEVDIIERGKNYGWNVFEGVNCFRAETCDLPEHTPPVAEYLHTEDACAVTGGFVYRGAGVPEIAESYIFADYCSGQVWALPSDLSVAPVHVATSADRVSAIGIDHEGELYLVSLSGPIFRIVSPD